MKLQPPSVGCLYLLATVLGTVALCVWLFQPLWFERQGPARVRAECAYLLRLASRSPDEQRTALARECFGKALQHSTTSGDWQLVFETLEQMHAEDLTPEQPRCTRIAPGCWATGLDAERWSEAGGPVHLLLHNDAAVPMRAEVQWHAPDGAGARWSSGGGTPQSLSFDSGVATLRLPDVPAQGYAMAVVAPVPAGARLRLTEFRFVAN